MRNTGGNQIDLADDDTPLHTTVQHDLYEFPTMDAHFSNIEDKKLCFKVTVRGFLITTSFVICGIVFVLRSKDRESMEEYSNEGSEIYVSTIQPPVAKNITDLCTTEKLRNRTGGESCVEICKRGVCCLKGLENVSKSSSNELLTLISAYKGENCFSLYPNICIGYEPCNHLINSEVKYAPLIAPENLKYLCKNNFSACAIACEPGSCCRKDFLTSCGNIFPDECDGYTPCDMIHLKDAQQISEMCSLKRVTTEEGRKDCESICLHASCCSSSSKYSCAYFAMNFCKKYEPCIILDLLPKTESVKVPTSQTTGVQVGNKSQNIQNSVVVDNIQNNLSDNIRNIMSSILNACTKESISKEEGRRMCEMLCTKSKCCFSEGAHCNTNNTEFCLPYDACEILFKTKEISNEKVETNSKIQEKNTNDSENLEESIRNACTETSLTGFEGKQMCQLLCAGSECCFSEGAYCNAKNIEFCTPYNACEILFDTQEASDGEKVETNSEIQEENTNDKKNLEESIKNACTETSLTSYEGKQMCQLLCAGSECCFSERIQCVQSQFCVPYNKCEILYNTVP